MIRFVDMRAADIVGHRFAFWDTVVDRFVNVAGDVAWETWKEFIEAADFEQEDCGKTVQIDRFRKLCPEWVDKPPVKEGE